MYLAVDNTIDLNMNNEYNINMAKKNATRNSLVIGWFGERFSAPQIIEKLKEAGYEAISKSRLWSIYKNSNAYQARKPRKAFCTFCLDNKHIKDMYQGKMSGQDRVEFRMCVDCKDRLTPPQPIHQDGE